MKKIISIIIAIIDLSLLLAFVILPKKDFSYNENRYLQKFPVFDLDNIISGKFMSKLEDYLADNFPFREKLLGFKSKSFRLIGVYKQSDVYYGTDNKLYQEYKMPSNSDTIIKRVNNLNESINSEVYFMFVPTSIYINSDKVSKYNVSYDEGKTIDYFKDRMNVNFIDIRNILKENKNDYLYYGTDHHWTSRGAYLAYLEFCKAMNKTCNEYNFSVVSNEFYGTLYSKVLDNSLEYDYIEKVDDLTNYKVFYEDDQKYSDSLYNYSYLKEKDKYSFFLDNNHSLITIDNLDLESDDSILIIKDSYANAFIPLIAPSYKRIYVIDPRYYNSSISEFINENKIDKVLFIYNVLTIDDDLGIVSIK